MSRAVWRSGGKGVCVVYGKCRAVMGEGEYVGSGGRWRVEGSLAWRGDGVNFFGVADESEESRGRVFVERGIGREGSVVGSSRGRSWGG